MTNKQTKTKEDKEKEFDKHFKKIAEEIAAKLNNHYETHVVPKHGDILNLHKKH
jgi:hypothetical protein